MTASVPGTEHAADISQWTGHLFGLVGGALVLLAATTIGMFWYSHGMLADARDPLMAILSLRILQVTLGLLIGLTLTLLGVLVAWAGITTPLNVEAGHKEFQGKVVTSSPGVLLALCGTLVIVVALLQKVEVSEGDRRAYGVPDPSIPIPAGNQRP